MIYGNDFLTISIKQLVKTKNQYTNIKIFVFCSVKNVYRNVLEVLNSVLEFNVMDYFLINGRRKN